MSDAHKGKRCGKDNANWKGDRIGYKGLHNWVENTLGKPSECENCGRTKPPKGLGRGRRGYFDWANISGKYKRDVKDWKRLCIKCHRAFDKAKKI
jgi:hypothetical protein